MKLNSKSLKVILGGLIGLGLAVYFSQSIIEKKDQEGRSALYKIQKTYEEESKAITEPERAAGVNLDAKFTKSISELKALLQAKTGTDHTLFEAAMKLGNIYFENGQMNGAAEAFNQSLKFASGPFQKASSYFMIGLVHERDSKFKEAIETYTQGMSKGFDGLKPEFLLGLVRNHLKLNEIDRAKLFVEKLNKEFTGSSAATEAQEMVK